MKSRSLVTAGLTTALVLAGTVTAEAAGPSSPRAHYCDEQTSCTLELTFKGAGRPLHIDFDVQGGWDEQVYAYVAGVDGCEIRTTVEAPALTKTCHNFPEGDWTLYATGLRGGLRHDWTISLRG